MEYISIFMCRTKPLSTLPFMYFSCEKECFFGSRQVFDEGILLQNVFTMLSMPGLGKESHI